MTYAQKFEIIDVETNEVLNWKPLGREEKIGVSGAKATGEERRRCEKCGKQISL